MPANIPLTSNGGGCLTRNSPSRCMVDITASHKKLANSPNGYLLQPFKKLSPNSSQFNIPPSTKCIPAKEKTIELTITQANSCRPPRNNSNVKSVRISDSPPHIIGYDGGYDCYISLSPCQGDGPEDGCVLSPFSNGSLGGDRGCLSSDEEDIDYDDTNDSWEGGRNKSKEERRKWALQTALNTERNAITKNLTGSPPPQALSSGVQSRDNGPAFRVRTWNDSSTNSGCTVSPKFNDETNIKSPKAASSINSPPLLTTCKPISRHKNDISFAPIMPQEITTDKNCPILPPSDNDTFMSDVLGHISDFLMAENVKNELGEKSLLEEIAESFKCVTLCNMEPLPKAQSQPDPIENSDKISLEPAAKISSPQPVLCPSTNVSTAGCCREECKTTSQRAVENKSFLFSHAGSGLLGKLCTVATSIRESITAHPIVSTTTTTSQSVSSPALASTKNDIDRTCLASPPTHLYDLIASTDGLKQIQNAVSAPSVRVEIVEPERKSVKASISLESPPISDSGAGSGLKDSPLNAPNLDRIISPVYEELNYGPPIASQRSANFNDTGTPEQKVIDGDACKGLTTPSTIVASTLNSTEASGGSTIDLIQSKGVKRNAVANFFQKSSSSSGASHKPSFLGIGSGSRKGTREIRKEDIVVVLTSPISNNSEVFQNVHQTITTTTEAVKVSPPPITCNGNSIIRFDSKLAAIAKDVNDYKGETAKIGSTSDLSQRVETKDVVTVLSKTMTPTLTEHSSLPTLSSSGAGGRFDKSLFDSTKSNSLDTNRAQTKNTPDVPVLFSKTTPCSKKSPAQQTAEPACQGVIKTFLHLNPSKKRNGGGTLRSKSLDKSTAGLMPSSLSAVVVANADRRTTQKGAAGLLMTVGDKKPFCTSSFVDLNSIVAFPPSSEINTPSNLNSLPLNISAARHNDCQDGNSLIDGHPQIPTPLGNNGSGKFASLKKFFRKAPPPLTISGHRDSHQRSSLACLTEQRASKQSASPSSTGWGRCGAQRSHLVSSSYDDSGVSLTRTAPEDDYATRKNPSSSALDSFSSEESWSVSSNSAPDDRINHPQQGSFTTAENSKIRPDLQSKPLPPIPVNRESGSNLAFPNTHTTTNTSSSSELEFSGEGIVTARAQLMKNNASPLQKPLGKPRGPPPKPPVSQKLDKTIPHPTKNTTTTKEDTDLPLDLKVEPRNQMAKLPRCPPVLNKPQVPARPPKLSPKTAQPLGKCVTASMITITHMTPRV